MIRFGRARNQLYFQRGWTKLEAHGPIKRFTLRMSYCDHKDNVILLLENHGIREPGQYPSAGVLCVGRVKLRMRDNLRKGGADFRKESICCNRDPLKIPF